MSDPVDDLIASLTNGLNMLRATIRAQEMEILRLSRIECEQDLMLKEKVAPVQYQEGEVN